MKTVISQRSNGLIIDKFDDKSNFNGTLNSDFIAKYCNATGEETNVSEIPDWATAEELT